MSVIENYPALRPSFFLDFANSGRVDPRISCVRASTATCCGPDGKRRTVASNVPRIDYDPATGKCLGLLVEEARTNHCIAPNNLTSSGAWFLEGACSAEYFAADGGYSVLSVTGATYTARPASPSISTDLSMVISCEVKRTATSQKVYVQRNGYVGSYLRVVYDFNTETVMLLKGGEAVSSGYGAVKLEDGWVRIWVAGAVRTTEISTNQQITLGEVLPGQSVAVRRFQMEAGNFPSSHIPTAGTAVTRAAENIQLADLGSWYRRESGTWVADYMLAERTLSGTETIICASHKTENSRLQVRTGVVAARNAAGTQFETVIPVTRSGRIATTYGGGKSSTAKSGVLSAEVDYTTPVDAQRLHLGVIDTFVAGYWLNGYITRVAYIPAQLTRAQLQRISTT